MSSSRASLALLLLAFAACSDADSGSETKDQPSVVLECEEGFLPTITVGARQLAAGDCIDTEEAIVLELCVGQKGFDKPTFACVQTEAGERYWVRNHDQLRGLTPGFTPCSEPDESPPPPCFVGNCGPSRYDFPFSNCSQEQTELRLRCGESDSVWDENCCRRPFCENGACEAGFVCRPLDGTGYSTFPYATIDAEGAIVCDFWGYQSASDDGCVPE